MTNILTEKIEKELKKFLPMLLSASILASGVSCSSIGFDFFNRPKGVLESKNITLTSIFDETEEEYQRSKQRSKKRSVGEKSTKSTTNNTTNNTTNDITSNITSNAIESNHSIRYSIMGRYPEDSNDIILILGGLHGDEQACELASREIIKNYKFDSSVIIFNNLNKTGERKIEGIDPNRVFSKEYFEKAKGTDAKRAYLVTAYIDKFIHERILPHIDEDDTLTAISFHTGRKPFSWKIIYDDPHDTRFVETLEKRLVERLNTENKELQNKLEGYPLQNASEKLETTKYQKEIMRNNEILHNVQAYLEHTSRSQKNLYGKRSLDGHFSSYFKRICAELYNKRRQMQDDRKIDKKEDSEMKHYASSYLSITPEGTKKTNKDAMSKKMLIYSVEEVLNLRGIRYVKEKGKDYRLATRDMLEQKGYDNLLESK